MVKNESLKTLSVGGVGSVGTKFEGSNWFVIVCIDGSFFKEMNDRMS